MIAVAHAVDGRMVDAVRDFSLGFDRVEVGDEGDGDPVVPGNALVAGDDCAEFTGLAAAETDRRFSADALEVDCVVTGRVELAEGEP